MKPYIITLMMTTIDGRIDCPVVGQLSTDEYYIALERLGACSNGKPILFGFVIN